jgi:serine-type D-Ala-D-Ala endopeptidase (penicillin-binding protein 7)
VTRHSVFAIALLCLLAGIAPVHAAASKGRTRAAVSPDVRSKAALVLDRTTGAVVYSRKADAPAPIASITKLMTALVVLDGQQPLDEVIEIAPADKARTQGNPSRLAVGSKLTRRELLNLALMSSENRAAQALGRSYPGGETAFVRTMNAKARALGMTQSRFVDPSGLSGGNIASASDLAKLVMAANKSWIIREYSTSERRTVKVGRQMLEFRNTNPLVRDPNWQISVQKTGHIAEAGQCLVLQAQIDGRPMVIVLLNSVGKYTRVADARRIRQWIGARPPGALTASNR